MKPIMNTTLLTATLFLAMACNNQSSAGNKENEAINHATTMQQEERAPSSNSTMTVKDDGLNAIYQQYIRLTKALTDGNVAEAKIASNAIEAGANEIKGGTSIAKIAARITAATDIKAQRVAYSKMSKDMITLLKKAGVSNGELYIEYCPMAFGDEGASWISSSKEINNPYLGEKMLQCGNVEDTIK